LSACNCARPWCQLVARGGGYGRLFPQPFGLGCQSVGELHRVGGLLTQRRLLGRQPFGNATREATTLTRRGAAKEGQASR